MTKPSVNLYILLFVVSAAVALSGEEAYQKQGETPLDIASELGLGYPIQVKSVGHIPDGGSLMIQLMDSATNQVRFFEDYGLATKTPGQRSLSLTGKREDAKVLSQEDGQRVLHQIITLLVDWVDREYTAEEQKELARLAKLQRTSKRLDGNLGGNSEYRKWQENLDSSTKSLPADEQFVARLKPKWAMYILTQYMDKEPKKENR